MSPIRSDSPKFFVRVDSGQTDGMLTLPILLELLTAVIVVEIENDRLLRTGALDRQLDRIDIDAW